MKTENSRRQTTLTDQISEPESFSPMIKSFEKKSNSRSCKFFILSHLRNCEKNTWCVIHIKRRILRYDRSTKISADCNHQLSVVILIAKLNQNII